MSLENIYQGVQVVTSEERRAGQVADALREAEVLSTSPFTYALIPADRSKPLIELTASRPSNWTGGDYLMDHLKPSFRGGSNSGKEVDLSLMKQQATQTLAAASGGPSSVSDAALQQVAQEGNVESFALVHPTNSNRFIGINVYLDEIGMLKRLPLNTRMMDFAKRAGYDPAPQFYGDVYIGRIRKELGSNRIHNQSFALGTDTDLNAAWLEQAMTDNLEYQMEMNRITGRTDLQPALDGTDGKAKQEESFIWTQTEEELEVTVPLPSDTSSKQVQVKFLPRSLCVTCAGNVKVDLQLFESIDVDGCTWTMERTSNGSNLLITMEKIEAALWSRVRD